MYSAITVFNTVTSVSNTIDNEYTIEDYDATDASKLVVTTATGDREGDGQTVIDSISFGSQSLLRATGTTEGSQSSSIYYLDGPLPSSNTITITYSGGPNAGNQNAVGFSAFSLTGSAPGVADSSSTANATNSGALTTLLDGSLIVGSFATNAGDRIDLGDGSEDGAITTVLREQVGGSGAGGLPGGSVALTWLRWRATKRA
jgi:hypothetical protein